MRNCVVPTLYQSLDGICGSAKCCCKASRVFDHSFSRMVQQVPGGPNNPNPHASILNTSRASNALFLQTRKISYIFSIFSCWASQIIGHLNGHAGAVEAEGEDCFLSLTAYQMRMASPCAGYPIPWKRDFTDLGVGSLNM